MHFIDLHVVLLEFPNNHLLVVTRLEQTGNFSKFVQNFRQFVVVSLEVLGSVEQGLRFVLDRIQLVFKEVDLVRKISFVYLIQHHNVVVSMLTNCTPKANAAETIFAESLQRFSVMVAAELALAAMYFHDD